jgi:hypothetical protein
LLALSAVDRFGKSVYPNRLETAYRRIASFTLGIQAALLFVLVGMPSRIDHIHAALALLVVAMGIIFSPFLDI